MSKRDYDPDLLAARIKKQNPSISAEKARKISEESCRRVDAERREQATKKDK